MREPAGDPLDPRHLGPEAVRRYLRAHGLAARKELSQNHLADGEVLAAIVAAADLAPGRLVLEVGPGLGILTGALLEAGAAVIAVELDKELADLLLHRFAGRGLVAPAGRGTGTSPPGAGEPGAGTSPPGGAEPDTATTPPGPGELRLIEGDVLATPIREFLAPPYDVVANIPYHITSPILHHVLGEEPRPDRFVLMLQREVAERIAAAPGQMSYVSVFTQYHADVAVARIVPRGAFEPAPKVDSAILAGTVRSRRLSPDAEANLWRVVQAGFRERRKMLHNVLARQLPDIGHARVAQALARAGIAPERRPQTLSVEEWLALSAELAAPAGAVA